MGNSIYKNNNVPKHTKHTNDCSTTSDTVISYQASITINTNEHAPISINTNIYNESTESTKSTKSIESTKSTKSIESTKSTESTESNDLIYLLIDLDGNILNMSNSFCYKMKYNFDDIHNKYIGILMTNLMSYLHNKIFLPNLKNNHYNKESILNRLASNSNKRPFIIYDADREPHFFNMRIISYDQAHIDEYNFVSNNSNKIDILYLIELEQIYDNCFITNLKSINELNTHSLSINNLNSTNLNSTNLNSTNLNSTNSDTYDSELNYELNSDLGSISDFSTENSFTPPKIKIKNNNSINNMFFANSPSVSTDFNITKNDIVLICIDFINSTQMLLNLGTNHMIKISKSFYNDVIELIKRKYYPYIYIYEIVGDSFMFIINADWTYNIEMICATIGMNFVKNLIKKTESYVQIRVGISYGKLSYGKIGNNLRLFGQIVNMSSRLESISMPKIIVTSSEFWNKFINEIKLIKLIKNNMDTIEHVQKDIELKGFGIKKCIFVDVHNIESLFVGMV